MSLNSSFHHLLTNASYPNRDRKTIKKISQQCISILNNFLNKTVKDMSNPQMQTILCRGLKTGRLSKNNNTVC